MSNNMFAILLFTLIVIALAITGYREYARNSAAIAVCESLGQEHVKIRGVIGCIEGRIFIPDVE